MSLKNKIAIFGMIVWSVLPVLAQTDSAFGFRYTFTDKNGDGINDNYIVQDNAPEYKFEFGLGYGYGFADRDSSGTNDILKLYPNAITINPLIDSTRTQGLGRIKHGEIRHGETTDPKAIIDRTRLHALYDGHCKSDSVYNRLRIR